MLVSFRSNKTSCFSTNSGPVRCRNGVERPVHPVLSYCRHDIERPVPPVLSYCRHDVERPVHPVLW